MIAAAIIVLREVFEAALIIGIVLAATRGVAHRSRWVVAGVALGLLGSIVVAAFAQQIASALEGAGQEVFNASVLLAATAMLGWHNFWMKSHGAVLSSDMQSLGGKVSSGATPRSILLLVVGLAVLREGAEVVLFLYGVAAGGAAAAQMLVGSMFGLASGIAIGVALYLGLLRIPVRRLFQVTGWLLLLLAAGMAAQAAGFLVQAGVLPALADPVWNSSAWLPERGLLGQVLHALLGYVERPSGMQLLFFVAVAFGLGSAMRAVDRAARKPAPRVAGVAVVVISAIALGPSPARAAHVVYSPIIEQDEIAIEYRAHNDFDSERDRNGGEEHKLEVEYSLTAFWRTELLTKWQQQPGGAFQSTEVSWENVFQLTPQGKYWADFGLIGEYAHTLENNGADAIELGLLVEKQLARTVVTANLLAERELRSGADSALSYALRWRYRWSQRIEPGIELHGELGDWGRFARLQDHSHAIGPSVYGKFRPSHAVRGALKYEAALLFGLTAQSPDSVLRLQLEYEF